MQIAAQGKSPRNAASGQTGSSSRASRRWPIKFEAEGSSAPRSLQTAERPRVALGQVFALRGVAVGLNLSGARAFDILTFTV